MHGPGLLVDVSVALALALVGGLVARRLRLSPVVGYMAAGIAVGPFTPGFHADTGTIHQLAQVGVVFLMFGVGLHFNLRDLVTVRRIAIPAGVAQVVLVASIAGALAMAIGLASLEAAVFGMALTISSTVVLVRTLEERSLTTSTAGRLLVGWLIVQDFATIVMLVLLPVLASVGGDGRIEALRDAALAVLFVAVTLAAGSRIVPLLLRLVGRTGSRELFVLVVVCLSLGIAVGSEVAGASLALGAFIAGVTVSETEGSHQAASDVLPLRDAFAVLFFVSIGMLIDPRSLTTEPLLLAVAILTIVVVKPIVSGLLTAPLPVPGRVAFITAAGLGQAGEFSFILAEAGRTLGIVEPNTYHAILAASVFSITVNPLAFRVASGAETRLRSRPRVWRWLDRQGTAPETAPPPSHHVVIAGAGRVGRLAGQALEGLAIPHVYIEATLDSVIGMQQHDLTAYWGDAASPDVLVAAGIGDAVLLILAVPDAGSARLAASHARRLNPGIAVIARAHSQTEVEALRQAGVDVVVVPEFEGAATILRRSLGLLALPDEQIERVLTEALAEEYDGTAGHRQA
ncbi:MAG: sodium:proton antiporter [Dehalococcoidia bacterium]|nr:MAG: sodium:proton antiporter [Dehalococcoidia bacterium]